MPIKTVTKSVAKKGFKKKKKYGYNRKARLTKMVRTGNWLQCKRTSCGRLMTLYGTTQSVGVTFNFNGTTNLMEIVTPAGIGTYYCAFGVAFCLADLPNVTEFTNLWDNYRIPLVNMKLIPLSTGSLTISSSGGYPYSGGYLHDCVDDNDYATPTASDVGIDEFRQKTSYKVRNIATGRPLKRLIKPRITMAGATSGGTFSSAVSEKPQFISCGYTSAVHYGYKGIIEVFNSNAGAASAFYLKVEPTYYLQFSDMK